MQCFRKYVTTDATVGEKRKAKEKVAVDTANSNVMYFCLTLECQCGFCISRLYYVKLERREFSCFRIRLPHAKSIRLEMPENVLSRRNTRRPTVTRLRARTYTRVWQIRTPIRIDVSRRIMPSFIMRCSCAQPQQRIDNYLTRAYLIIYKH